MTVQRADVFSWLRERAGDVEGPPPPRDQHAGHGAAEMPAIRRPGLSVVIPCYNEEDVVAELYRRVTAVCANSYGDDFEIVLVNDGSHDRTWQCLCDLAISDPRVIGVNLSRNHGHQLALTAGLHICRGERILILDGDLQDPPELLPRMSQLMDDGYDIVYGKRLKREGDTLFKRWSAHVFYRLLDRISDVRIPVDTGDFRLMSRRALDVLNSMPENQRFVRGMVSWIGLPQVPLLYERAPRFAGESKYPLSKMVQFAFDAVTGFSIRPLRLASYLGFAFGLLGVALMGYVIFGYATHRTISGWTSLAMIILILGSVQLVVAGVIGEYLGRLYIESKRRPLFIIQDIVSGGVKSSRVPSHVFERVA